jgi:phosphate/sulfate permease
MALTLWFSKKARSVVQTSVNLGRQDEGAERFQANGISRGIVKGTMAMSTALTRALPERSVVWIRNRFVNHSKSLSEDPMDKPAFDLVRASVNLIVAAGIILVATSLKQPLSTTFVSFMVLMGTSLADNAWAKGSAVYRVSGMLTVIGGWFLTAIIALTVSLIFASLLINFKIYALVILVLLAVFLIFRSHVFYRHNRYKAEVNLELADAWFKTDFFEIESEVRGKLVFILERIDDMYARVLMGLVNQDRKALNELSALLDDIESTNDLYKVKLTQQIKEVPEKYQEGGKILMLVYDLEDELLYALSNIIRFSSRHINNLHPELQNEQVDSLLSNKSAIKTFMDQILERFKQNHISANDYKAFKKTRKVLIYNIEEGISRHIALATSKKLSGKNSELILTILLSSKDMVATCSRLIKLFYKVKTEDLSNMLDKLMEE